MAGRPCTDEPCKPGRTINGASSNVQSIEADAVDWVELPDSDRPEFVPIVIEEAAEGEFQVVAEILALLQ